MNIEFAISGWSAYAAGLSSPDLWEAWAAQPRLPDGEEQPALAEMPALLRRRLGLTGRLAAQVAYRCQPPATGTPIVFASRYGDAIRSLDLLGEFAAGESVSPTDFALSVHNAIGAMYSIARRDTANYSAVAAGPATAAAGVAEAAGLLDDGAAEVMLVCYDAPLPGDYATFADEAQAPYAWAWCLRKPLPGDDAMTLSAAPARSEAGAPTDLAHRPSLLPSLLPFGLDVLRFALSGDPVLQRSCEGTTWTWRRIARRPDVQAP